MRLVPNRWSEFQHYKDRNPPWIRLHRKLLDNRDFQRLPLASRALAPMLWLLASESKDGSFDGSIEELAFRLRCQEQEIEDGLNPLIDKGFFLPAQDASSALAASAQAAPESCSETETEAERETEEKPSASSAAKLPPCPHAALVSLYHEVLPELPAVRLMTDGRKKALAKTWGWVLSTTTPEGERRAQTAEEAQGWFRRYFERARDNDFLMGRSQRTAEHANWRCDLDFLLTDKGMKHVIEKTREPA